MSRKAACLAAVFGMVLLGSAQAGQPLGAQAPSIAPLSPQFVRYMEQRQAGGLALATEEGHGFGLLPEPIDLSDSGPYSLSLVETPLGLPSYYDLRALGKLTPVKDQGACGSCWAFATYGSMESCLLTPEAWDFSENNLKNTHGFDWTHCYGGNRLVSTAYLARWSGPVTEADDPYDTSSDISPTGLPVWKHVQDVMFVPDRTSATDNDALKSAVMTYGACQTSMYYGAYYNPDTCAYYCPATDTTNHAVCIVGWDDNFSASNFTITPPGNGAFIVRNSWGGAWGDGGYFYISYYDAAVGNYNALFHNAEPPGPLAVYQYDPLGWVSSVGYSSTTAWGANVFTATSDQTLVAVSFYTKTVNSSYEAYIYLDPTSGPLPSSGPAASKSGSFAVPGYHTVYFDSGVSVSAGHKFSAVVKLTTPGYNYPVPLEMPLADYSSSATASAGESYISSNGSSWTDVTSIGWAANTNVCLKAFALLPTHVVGDTDPLGDDLNSDGDTDDCREFGDGAIDWMDVIRAYYCFIGVACPEVGSVRYDAMDSYTMDQVDSSCNVAARGGDGSIGWMDVIATYYRFADPAMCRPQRPCGP